MQWRAVKAETWTDNQSFLGSGVKMWYMQECADNCLRAGSPKEKNVFKGKKDLICNVRQHPWQTVNYQDDVT